MYKSNVKRVMDVLLAVVLFPFWLVVFLIVGFLIYMEDQGPVLYRAPRVGQHGEVFIMYKFRSMKVNAPDIRNEDGSTFNSKDDPRLTKIGRLIRETSIDETPQILNILKGDMSFIGPRPDLPDQIELYEGEEKRKLEVKPGITGYSQAYYRNSVPWKERIRNDIFYVDNMSFWLDVKIFLMTIMSVFRREAVFMGASSESPRES